MHWSSKCNWNWDCFNEYHHRRFDSIRTAFLAIISTTMTCLGRTQFNWWWVIKRRLTTTHISWHPQYAYITSIPARPPNYPFQCCYLDPINYMTRKKMSQIVVIQLDVYVCVCTSSALCMVYSWAQWANIFGHDELHSMHFAYDKHVMYAITNMYVT